MVVVRVDRETDAVDQAVVKAVHELALEGTTVGTQHGLQALEEFTAVQDDVVIVFHDVLKHVLKHVLATCEALGLHDTWHDVVGDRVRLGGSGGGSNRCHPCTSSHNVPLSLFTLLTPPRSCWTLSACTVVVRVENDFYLP